MFVSEGCPFPISDKDWTTVPESEWGDDWVPQADEINYREIFLNLAQGGQISIAGKNQHSSVVLIRSQLVCGEEGDKMV
jgi:hypothetical protein